MANLVVDALIHLGYGQLRGGFIEDALGTFSAAHILDESDARAIEGRERAASELNRQPPATH